MSSNLPAATDGADIMEAVITKGDLGKLTPAEKVEYYAATCRSLGLNPLTKPFDYLTLSGKTVLYAGRTATDQLRRINGVSIIKVEREERDGVLIVTATARDKSGREDSEIGAVNIGGLKGDALANAWMKATTKAKRRVTLSICGLGWLDETEVETIPHARTATVDVETGELVDAAQTRQDAPRAIEAAVEASEDFAPATARQLEMIQERWGALRLKPALLNAQIRKLYGGDLGSLDRTNAADLIARLDRKITEASPAGITPQPADEPGMDDAGYAQVVAAIDAEAAPANADRWTN